MKRFLNGKADQRTLSTEDFNFIVNSPKKIKGILLGYKMDFSETTNRAKLFKVVVSRDKKIRAYDIEKGISQYFSIERFLFYL